MPESDRISPDGAAFPSTIQSSPNPSLYDLKQQIVRELLVLHQCYSRLNQDSNQPERFMSFVHSLFSLLPPELQLTEAEIAAIDQLVSPNQSPFIPAASQAFLEQLPSVAVSKCPDLINEDCPVCQEPFTAESSLTKSSDDLSNIASRVVELPCEHIFHFPCVAAWMSQHNTCPCCRFKVPTDNALYNETVIRQQPEPVRKHQRLKRRACEISQPCIPPPAKRPLCVRSSRCALSAHGLPCLLPVRRRSDSPSPEPSPDTVEHLSCGHSFHLQCLHTALALLGVATLQPDIGPCPLCCLHSASPDSADRLQRMTLPLVSIQPESSRPSSPVQYRISPVPANQHQDRFLR